MRGGRRLLALIAVMLLVWGWEQWRGSPEPAAHRTIRAANGAEVHVIDGDSLRIGKDEIRIAGIDAPEYRQTCGDGAGGSWDCGKAARAELVRLAGAGGLACTERARDRYGRSLADCRTDAGDVALALARAGFVESAGDPRFDSPYADAIAAARAAKRGIWRGPHVRPAEWRKAQRPEQPRPSD